MIFVRSVFEVCPIWVSTFLHPATTPPASIVCAKKYLPRHKIKLYIIRRRRFSSTIAGILPIICNFTDNFKILPIEKQAQARGYPSFFTYFTYFTNRKVLHRRHKKNYGNIILPIFAVESVKYRWNFCFKIIFIFFLFFYLTFIFLIIIIVVYQKDNYIIKLI